MKDTHVHLVQNKIKLVTKAIPYLQHEAYKTVIISLLFLFTITAYLFTSNLIDTRIETLETENHQIQQSLQTLKKAKQLNLLEHTLQNSRAQTPILTSKPLETKLKLESNSFQNLSFADSKSNTEDRNFYQSWGTTIKFTNTPDYEIFKLIHAMFSQPNKFGYGRIYEFYLQKDPESKDPCCGSGHFG